METLHRDDSANRVWGPSDRPPFRATEHAVLAGPCDEQAKSK